MLILILCIISFLSSVITFAFYYYLSYIYPVRTGNRRSTQISLALATCCLFLAVLQPLRFNVSKDSALCKGAAYLYTLFSLLFLFLVDAFALHLHLIFIARHRVVTPKWTQLKNWIFYVPFMAALSISTVGFLLGKFGWNKYDKTCMFKETSTKEGFIWSWGLWYSWLSVGLVYCFFVAVSVLWRIKRSKSKFEKVISARDKFSGNLHIHSEGSVNPGSTYGVHRTRRPMPIMAKSRPNIRILSVIPSSQLTASKQKHNSLPLDVNIGVALRVIRFPIIPLITQLPILIREICHYIYFNSAASIAARKRNEGAFGSDASKVSPWLTVVETMASLSGSLVLVAYLLDPMISKTWGIWKKDQVEWHYSTSDSIRNSGVSTKAYYAAVGRFLVDKSRYSYSSDLESNQGRESYGEESLLLAENKPEKAFLQ